MVLPLDQERVTSLLSRRFDRTLWRVQTIIFLFVLLFLPPSHAAENSGLFFPWVNYPLGSLPWAVTIGDVNGDGRNDVVVGTAFFFDPVNDYSVHVFLQDANGQLLPPVRYSGGNGNSVQIGDLNNDDRLDVVVSVQDGIGVFLQNPSGTLEPIVTYPSNHSSPWNSLGVRIGDFNGDGLRDVVSIDWGSHSHDVEVFMQNSQGKLDAPVVYQVAHEAYDDLAVGDVNSDGLDDIVVVSGGAYISNQLGILRQEAGGGMSAPSYYDLGLNEIAHGVAIGDINGDNMKDVVVSYHWSSAHVATFFQNGAHALDPPAVYSSLDGPYAIQIEDVNADGRKDLVTLLTGAGGIGVFLQDSDGLLLPQEFYVMQHVQNKNPHGMRVGDVNGDGLPDVVYADPNYGLVVHYHTPPSKGTLGTVMTITGFALGPAPPTVYVEYEGSDGRTKRKKAKILQWSDISIRCHWQKRLPPGQPTVVLWPGQGDPIPLKSFEMVEPQINGIDPSSGASGETMQLRGRLFGSSRAKLKVYFEYVNSQGVAKKKKCRIVRGSCIWDPQTGLGSLVFRVPRLGPVTGAITLKNKIGVGRGVPFTIN